MSNWVLSLWHTGYNSRVSEVIVISLGLGKALKLKCCLSWAWRVIVQWKELGERVSPRDKLLDSRYGGGNSMSDWSETWVPLQTTDWWGCLSFKNQKKKKNWCTSPSTQCKQSLVVYHRNLFKYECAWMYPKCDHFSPSFLTLASPPSLT